MVTRISSSPFTGASATSGHLAPERPALTSLFISLRPEQWTKNLFVFAGLIFGGRLLQAESVLRAATAFLIFCALSGAVYLVNDVMDQTADRAHPLKRHRPIAAGLLSIGAALGWSAALASIALAAAASLSTSLLLASAAYLALFILYSLVLKHQVIVDVLTIAGGFVLRASAGALAVDVPISDWLLLCTTLLALFLALTKRRHELTLLAEDAAGHRPILGEYTPYLLDQMIGVVAASTLVAYCVYATSEQTAERLGTRWLIASVPFVLYGLLRYLYLVHQKRGGGSPAAMLATDRPLLVCVALWALTVVGLLYGPAGVR